MFFLIVAIILALLIIILFYFLSIQNPDTEKLSSYECGFEPCETARNIFDVKFYIVAIIFILFDSEAMFLFSWSICFSQLSVSGFWSMISFIFELGISFV